MTHPPDAVRGLWLFSSVSVAEGLAMAVVVGHIANLPYPRQVGNLPHDATAFPHQKRIRLPYFAKKSCTMVTSRTCRLSGSKTRILT
jgi:hypothetical protein